jgi:hypothetical protein
VETLSKEQEQHSSAVNGPDEEKVDYAAMVRLISRSHQRGTESSDIPDRLDRIERDMQQIKRVLGVTS